MRMYRCYQVKDFRIMTVLFYVVLQSVKLPGGKRVSVALCQIINPRGTRTASIE